ncbi:RIP metalloprotease RseP [Acetoanaerobium noterae]|uniref:RIP metalloprotease RseP n=1 Tax=Acetoanaerobium noterae TaxID=745369 RepID=UPI0028AAF972|nr:RIP metalloprotease RseP [Acetoanaerobium noterae]
MNLMTIIIALIVFGVIVTVHEMGHFFTAKYFGVTVHEFSVGMGPKLYSKTKKETEYSLRALPLGGYVRMEGEDSESQDPNSFNNKHPLKRMAIIFAGPFMNFILTIVLMSFLFMMIGVPVNKIGDLVENMPAYNSGLEVGDKIIMIDDKKIDSWQSVTDAIQSSPDNNLEFTIERNNEQKIIAVDAVEQAGRKVVGISPASEKSPGKSLVFGTNQTILMLTDMLSFLGKLFTGQAGDEGVVGPVGIISAVGEAARTGFANVISLAAIISLNLGLINLLPIPALDGSRIVFQAIELVRGKKIDPEKEGFVHMIGMILLLALMLFITSKDILRIFG